MWTGSRDDVLNANRELAEQGLRVMSLRRARVPHRVDSGRSERPHATAVSDLTFVAPWASSTRCVLQRQTGLCTLRGRRGSTWDDHGDHAVTARAIATDLASAQESSQVLSSSG